MKKITLLLTLCIISLLGNSQAPDYTWANIIGGNNDDRPNIITTDQDGNCYLGSYFYSDSITIGNETYYNQGQCDMLLIKYDTDGNLIWSRSFAGDHFDFIEDMHIDEQGKIYICGSFASDSIQFDSITLYNENMINWGSMDAYIATLKENGNVIYAESFGGIHAEQGLQLEVDDDGNYYFAGTFSSPTFQIRDTTLTISGQYIIDIFVIKFDSIHELKWIKRSMYGEHQNNLIGMCITPDSSLYLSGFFDDEFISFDTCTAVAYDDGGMFLTKYDLDGNIQFANNYGNYAEFQSAYGSITSDNNSNIIMTGHYWGSHFIFNNDTLVNNGDNDFFTCKFDNQGNPLWATGSGYPYVDFSNSVVTDVEDNIYITGSLQSTTTQGDTLYFSDSVYIIVHSVGQYIAKYDPDGTALWALTNSSQTSQLTEGMSIAIDSQSSLFATGWFTSNTITFGNQTYQNNGTFDTYLVKLEQQLNLLQANMPTGPTDVCNNDVVEYITTSVTGALYYEWEVIPAEAGSIYGDSLVGTFYSDATWIGTFSVRVRAINNNYTSDWSQVLQCELNVSLTPFFLTGQGPYCEWEQGSEPILEDSEIGVNYELYHDNVPTGIIVTGTDTAISFGNVTEEGIYLAVGYSSDSCLANMWGDIWVYMIESPEQSGTPTGPQLVCNNEEDQYISTGSANADTLLWGLLPIEAGEIVSYGNDISINWDNEFSGITHLSCVGLNDCGPGLIADVLEIIVNNSPTPEISGLSLICKNNDADYETEYNVGATYLWEVTGGDIIAGSGTNIVTVKWGDTGTGYLNLLEIDSIGCEQQTEDFIITIDECLAVDNQNNTKFSIIPNPTKDWIIIKGSNIITNIYVLDQIGNVIISRNGSNENEHKLDLSRLPSGIYFLRIVGEKTKGIYKIVKL